MFKSGDKVKYIKNGKYCGITLNKIYTVEIAYFHNDTEYVRIVNDFDNTTHDIFAWRFELCLRDQRKQKLKQINLCSK